MKILKRVFLLFLFLNSCASLEKAQPPEYKYIPVKTEDYILASLQKITKPKAPIKIYIEGDGIAYDKRGNPSGDPTPKSRFLRDIAFADPYENVVYLARPGQFIKIPGGNRRTWTDERYSQKTINNLTQAIKTISQDAEIILIGYSGGALLSGIIINQNPDLKVKEWITIAGLFGHGEWTKHFNYPDLEACEDLKNIPDIKQIHFIGKKDKIIPYALSIKKLPQESIVIIDNAGHSSGFEEVYPIIWNKK